MPQNLTNEPLAAGQTIQDNASAWSRRCLRCNRRLDEGEGPYCSRTSCYDFPVVAVPVPIAATFTGDGTEAGA